MKTRLLGTLLLLLFASATLRAQNPLMKAERIPWWDAEYLTLIWSGGIRSNDPKTIDYINGLVGLEGCDEGNACAPERIIFHVNTVSEVVILPKPSGNCIGRGYWKRGR